MQASLGTLAPYPHQRIDLPDKTNTETVALNATLDRMDVIDTFRAFQPKSAKIHSFQGYKEHFSRVGMFRHKTSLNKQD